MRHKKYHLSFWFILLLSTLLTSTTNAQTSYLDSLDGKFALQFQISESFTLTNFQGATFSGKYHTSKSQALRIGVSLSASDREDDFDTLTDTSTLQANADESSYGFTINSQYLFYFAGIDEVAFFGGAGPFVTYQNSENVVEIIESSLLTKREESRTNLYLGLDLIMGVEWFFHDAISLSAEYGLKFSYGTSDLEGKLDGESRNSTSKFFRINSNPVNFGISVYF